MDNHKFLFIFKLTFFFLTGMFALASHAQTEKVIVKVIDSKGTPIIGANVWNIDAKGGATTDDAGLCTLKATKGDLRSEEHTSELQSRQYLVCRLLLEKKKKKITYKLS